ncbi:hypothetical protein M422DRAFT_64329 [Sphaerobolus stellatus SS14]|nr:hypothetical protein M422DRAFT_64329 [Sphaerobolus stellatus SS14]
MSSKGEQSSTGPAKSLIAAMSSPGTGTFSPPTHPTRSFVTSSSSSSSQDELTRSLSILSNPPRDPAIPPEWYFESSYGFFGGGASSMAPTRSVKTRKKDPPQQQSKTHLAVFGESLFGRKKDKGKGKGKEKEVVHSPPIEEHTQNGDDHPQHVPQKNPLPMPVRPRIITDIASTSAGSKDDASSLASALTEMVSTPTRPPRSPLRTVASSNGYAENGESSSSPPGLTLGELDAHQARRVARVSTALAPIPASATPGRAPSPSHETDDAITPAEINGVGIGGRNRISAKLRHRQVPDSVTPKRLGSRRPATADSVPESRHNSRFAGGRNGFNSSAQRYGLNITSLGPVSANASWLLPSEPSNPPALEPPMQKEETPIEAFRRRMLEAREKGFTIKNGKRYHPKSKQEAPYPRDYEKSTLDHDRWENAFTARLARSPTFHPFPIPPARVLDLGCGSGDWILSCAREWENTLFVGMDLVPIQPDLATLGNKTLRTRITWVIGNFLEELPFEDEEFDFVHIKRVARGVPEDEWHPLFEEIIRVLKPEGAFEMVEEDLFFPGSKTITGESIEEDITPDLTISSSFSTQSSSLDTHTPQVEEEDGDSVRAQTLERQLFMRPLHGLQVTRPDSTVLPAAVTNAPEQILLMRSLHALRVTRPDSAVLPDEPKKPIDKEIADTNEYLPSTDGHAESRSPHGGALRSRMSLDAWQARAPTRPDLPPSEPSVEHHGDDEDDTDLFHASTVPPPNPRDHHILESVYNELHSARFINLTPLSILHSALTLHFRDIQTHEPAELPFPPENHQRDPNTAGRSRSNSSASQRSIDTTIPLLELLPLGRAMARDPRSTTKRTLELEPTFLQMHLAARVNEVLACAEEMWEFIEEARTSTLRWTHPDLEALVDIKREEWEECLTRFAMDMGDKIRLGSLMEQQFAWNVRKTPRTNDRKAFDDAVDRWETYRRREEQKDQIKRPPSHSQLLCRKFRVFIARK